MIIHFSNSENSPVDASKLRVRGGRKIEHEGKSYKIQSVGNSNRKNKKYVATVHNLSDNSTKKVHWGAKGYDDYYVHRDKKRRDNFQKRHGAIKTKDGKIASKDPTRPAFYATHANWSKNLDKSLNNYQYIPPETWNKIPKNLQKSIRAEEKKLGNTDVEKGPIKENKKLTKLYASARQFSDWSGSKFTYMNGKVS